MSISEIINYVNRTPHNTNPNVIASMVQGANEQAVYESVEKLKQDGGVGYIEPAKVILDVDLVTEEEAVIPSATVWIGEEMPLLFEEGRTYEVTSNRGSCNSVCFRDGSNLGVAGYFDGDEPNEFGMTFMVFSEHDGFAEYHRVIVVDLLGANHITVKAAETVRRIDGKYLPEGGAGYTESGKMICSVPLGDPGEDGSVGLYITDKYALEAGKMYQVTTDSGTYNALAQHYDVEGIGEIIAMGNLSVGGLTEDTGDSFMCANYQYEDGMYHLDILDINGGTYMTIYEAGTVHTIDPKYLPEGGMGYTETVKTEASVTLTSNNNMMNVVPISGRAVSLVEGRTYTVSVASDDPDALWLLPTIECVCVDISGVGEAFVIGNQALFDADESEDTGEWFMILEGLQDGEWMTMALWGIPSMSTTASIPANITFSAETTHKIDPKYLSVVEITSADYPAGELSGTSVPLSEEESAQLSAFAKAKIPANIRLKVDMGEMGLSEVCLSFDYMGVGGVMSIYLATFMNTDMVFIDDGSGNWIMGD